MTTNVYSLQNQLEKIKRNQNSNIMETIQYLFIRCTFINNRLIYYINDSVFNIIKENELYKCMIIIPVSLKKIPNVNFKTFSNMIKITSIHENHFIVQCQDNTQIKIRTYFYIK